MAGVGGGLLAPPPRLFDPSGPLYPQGTYAGRVWQMMHVSGPASWCTLAASPARLERARRLLASPEGASPEEVWTAKKLVLSAVHPDSGRVVPLPFRMAAHVPMNIALLVGMLSAPHNPRTQMFWQWCNQTFNACQFYANKNVSNAVSTSQLAGSYLGALAASLSTVAYCDRVLSRLERSRPRGSPSLSLARAFVPFAAAAASKPLQLAAMRADELLSGVTVYRRPAAPAGARGAPVPAPPGARADGSVPVGASRVAGAVAVAATVATRVLYLAQPMLLPPLLQAWLRRTGWAARRPRAAAAAHVLFVGAMSALATPLCIALFDQTMALPASALEPEFAALGDEPLYFNKGL